MIRHATCNVDFVMAALVVEVLIARIRRKLGPDLIRTARGHGYVIDPV